MMVFRILLPMPTALSLLLVLLVSLDRRRVSVRLMVHGMFLKASAVYIELGYKV